MQSCLLFNYNINLDNVNLKFYKRSDLTSDPRFNYYYNPCKIEEVLFKLNKLLLNFVFQKVRLFKDHVKELIWL
jgi:hypothetical protein